MYIIRIVYNARPLFKRTSILTITPSLVGVLVVSWTELQDVAVPRGRETDLVVGEAGRSRPPCPSIPATAPIEPRDAESLDASTESRFQCY